MPGRSFFLEGPAKAHLPTICCWLMITDGGIVRPLREWRRLRQQVYKQTPQFGKM